jgi:hypothetical protein
MVTGTSDKMKNPFFARACLVLLVSIWLQQANGQGLLNPSVALGAAEAGAGCGFQEFQDLLDLASETTGRGGGSRSGRRRWSGEGYECLEGSLKEGQVRCKMGHFLMQLILSTQQ